MVRRFNTGNPRSSNDMRDLNDNVIAYDDFINSKNKSTIDRFGYQIPTVRGVLNTVEDTTAQVLEQTQQAIDEAIRNAGYDPIDSFERGATLTSIGQALRLESTGVFYSWRGQYEKVVPPGSTPESTGGISQTAWVDVNDLTLRSDLSIGSGASIVMRSTVTCNSIYALLTLPTNRDLTANTASYHIPSLYQTNAEMPVGGSQYIYQSSMPKVMHNGGDIISDTVPWDGRYETHTNFMRGVGETQLSGRGCWVDTSNFNLVWKFGVFPFNNDGIQVGRDSTYQFQTCVFSAKMSSLISTHSVSLVTTVNLSGPYTWLLAGRAYIPEGVYVRGDAKVPARITCGWTEDTTKFSGYGVLHDKLNGNPPGTTFTKNWCMENVSLVPHYSEPGPAFCIYIDSLFDIEMHLSNVRFVMHKGAVGGGQLNAIGVLAGKGVDFDWQNITMDGGTYHLKTNPLTAFGMRTARISRLFSYNAREAGVHLDNFSEDNNIDLKCQMTEQSGSSRALYIYP